MARTLFFSTGDPSGDLHAAKLIRHLSSIDPATQIRGFGGPNMQSAGCDLDFELTNMAVMGIVEVLPKLREFYRIADIASDVFAKNEADGVVLIDFPGFNWHIAKRAKQRGLKVMYYLPPQLWAWGAWRVKKMRRSVDQVLCCLPFESKWYRDQGLNVVDVGHPFFDEVADKVLDTDFIAAVKSQAELTVAILPGSRSHEVLKNWPLQLEAIRRLSQKFPRVQFVVAAFREKQANWCKERLTSADANLKLQFHVGKTSEIIALADCALMVSGSVSLELMARGTPAVVQFHVGRILYTLGKAVATCDSMTLPNLISGRTLMPEFLSTGNPGKAIDTLTGQMEKMIGDDAYRATKRQELLDLAALHARPGASRNAAEAVSAFFADVTPNVKANAKTEGKTKEKAA